MNTIGVAEAEWPSSAPVDLVEAGETVSLSCRGKKAAGITPAARPAADSFHLAIATPDRRIAAALRMSAAMA